MSGFDAYYQATARLSRRGLLRLISYLGTASFLPPLAGCGQMISPRFQHDPFRLGVASGDPSADGVVLWTRLAPAPLDGGGMPTNPVEVGWEVAHDERFLDMARTGRTMARPELGHAVHVEVEGLLPARDYWYRFFVGDAASPIGRTRTAPDGSRLAQRLRFGTCGCANFEAGYFTAYRHMAEEAFDFIYHCGDYIYEAGIGGHGEQAAVRRHPSGEPYTLVDYRNRYALYKSDPDLMAAHASAPFVVSWDDHEVDNDWAADFDQDGTPPELFLLRRAAAYQAYYEHMPLRRRSLPTPVHLQLYRQIKFGPLLNLNVLDTRQYRSNQVCSGGYLEDCPDRLDPHRSLLGAKQESWLFEQLATSKAAWNVLAQQVPMFSLDHSAAGMGRYHMDKWDGYDATRLRLFRTLAERKPANPVILSGDVHTHWAADVKAVVEDPGSTTIGTEFTTTSITSGGDGSAQLDLWPVIQGNNPHIHYHSNRRGYMACEVTPERWTSTFKTIDRVTESGRPVRRTQEAVVECGRPGVLT